MALEKKIKVSIDASAAKKEIDALVSKMNGISGPIDRATGSTSKLDKSTKNLNSRIISTNRSLNAMSGLLTKIASAATVITGIKLADDFNELQNKLRLTIQEGESLIGIQEKLVDVSQQTRSSLQENALLYLRLSEAVDRTKTSQEELFRVTETVGKAIQVGGSSAQEAQGALRQFTQIISSGFTTGFSQELNSLSEQTPGLFKLIADGLRDTSQEFRDLEASGLSSIKILKIFSEKGIGDLDTLLAAIASQAGNIDKRFSSVNITVSKALKNLRTGIEEYIGIADDATGFTTKLAEKINEVALNFDDFVDDLKSFVIAGGAAITTFVTLTVVTKAFGAAMFLANNGLKAFILSLVKVANVAKIFTPVGLAITAASVAVGVLVAKTVKFENGLIRVGSRVTTFSGLIKAVTKTLNDRFQILFENIKIFASSTVDAFYNITISVSKFFDSLSDKDSALKKFLAFFIIDIPKALKEFANNIIGSFVFVGKAIAAIAVNIKESYERTFDDIYERAKLNAQAVAFLVKGNVVAALALRNQAKKIGEDAEDDAFDLSSKLSESFKSAFETDFVGDALTSTFEFIESSGESTISKLKFAWGDFKGFMSELKDEIESNIEPIVTAAAAPIGIRSSTFEEQIGFWERLIGLIKDGASAIVDFAATYSDEFNAMGDAMLAFSGLLSTLSDLRQKELDDELKTSTTLSDEERKVKEKNAKAAFENSKQLTLAGIALQTGLAIMNALADTTQPSTFVRVANATAAAAIGATQYAKANAQTYSAPSPPSASNTNVATENISNTQVTVNITGGDPSRIAQQLVEAFDNNELTFENGRFNSV